ncbi:MAG TPA: carboxypeptidase-like regulatory domain-containing protein [Planctomycetota bacterium]
MMLRRAMAAVLALVPVVAQGEAASPSTLRVRCVDERGTAVANAMVEVFVPRHLDGVVRFEHRTTRRSNAAGECEVTDAARIGWVGPWVHARVHGLGVGMRTTDLFGSGDVLTVVMTAPRTLRGTVHVPEGMRADSVQVRVIVVQALVPANREPGALRHFLDPQSSLHDEFERVLPGRLTANVAADGSFALAEVPSDVRVVLEARGAGLALTHWETPAAGMPERVELTLAREAVFAGLVSAPGGKPAEGAGVVLETDPVWSIQNLRRTSRFSGIADAEGRFRVTGLPEGQYVVSLRSGAGCLRPLQVTLATAERRDAALQLEIGVDVAGVVLAADDRSPVANAGVTVCSASKRFFSKELARTHTDAAGRFVLRVPVGEAWLHVTAARFGRAEPTELQLGRPAPALRSLEVLLQRSTPADVGQPPPPVKK